MLRILDLAPSLGAASHPQRCFSSSVWPPLATLRTMWEALREGLAVHRQYEELRSKGFAHDAALHRALAIGPPLPQPARYGCNKRHARCARPAYAGH
jgi:hypothetical protein